MPFRDLDEAWEADRFESLRERLGQYARFLAGEPPGSAKDADRIRQYVLEHIIESAREEGREQAEVLVRDVNTALDLNEAWPNICQALAGRKFQELAKIPPPEQIGADQSPATIFRFDLSDRRVDRSALDQLRDRFLDACTDFRSSSHFAFGMIASFHSRRFLIPRFLNSRRNGSWRYGLWCVAFWGSSSGSSRELLA